MKNKVAKKYGLKTNFIFNFISQILTLIVPLITTPYLARVLRETGNGQYSFASSIIIYFTLFASMGFDVYGQRQIAQVQTDKAEKSKIFWEIFVFKTILTAISLTVLYSMLFTVGFGENYNKLILILSIQVISVPFDIQFLYRGEEDFAIIAVRTIIMKIIGLICIFVFVRAETDTWIYALCVALSTVASYLVMWLTLFKRIGFVKIKELHFLRHTKPMLLIFLPTLAVTVYSVFDKTMIGLLAQNADYENGCYEQAYKLNSVALLLITIISSVMISRNASDHSRGDRQSLERHLYSACNYVWLMGIPLIVGFAFLSDNLSFWFLGEGYEKVPLLMQIMSVRFIVSGFGVVFGDQLFIAIGKEKYPTIAAMVSAVVNLALNYFLIPVWGATGAAIATAISEFLVTAILAFFVAKNKYLSLKRVLALSWKYLIAVTVMGAGIFAIQRFVGYGILTFLMITAAGVIIYALMLLILRDRFFIDNVKRVLNAVKAKLKKQPAGGAEPDAEDITQDTNNIDSEDDNA